MNGMALCAGVGGLELGLHLALGKQYRSVCYVERETYAAATLVARMEEQALDKAPVWGNLKTFDGKPWRGKVDIISGGYPCQPFSAAGRKLGERDPRHLWPDIRRVVQEVQPGICFFENVAGHLRLGYDDVREDLEGLGYRVESGLFSAAEVGGPHRRERLFILAYTSNRRGGTGESTCGSLLGRDQIHETEQEVGHEVRRDSERSDIGMANAVCERRQRLARSTSPQKKGHEERSSQDNHLATGCDEGLADPSIGERDGRLSVQSRGQDKTHTDIDWTSERLFPPNPTDTAVDDPEGWRLDNGNPDDNGTCEGKDNAPGLASKARKLFPPNPEDTDAWREVLEDDPTLEPAFCGVADGMAARVDRLRCCGNGVVPLVAAKAFVCLTARAYARSREALT